MAGVFGLITRPRKQLVGHHGIIRQADPRALELQAAMEILAEVFRIGVSDVEEMIQNRFDDIGSKRNGLWPGEFWLEG